jgi:hypothetical protein
MFVRTVRCYRTFEIQAGGYVITAARSLPTTSVKVSTASTAIPLRTNGANPEGSYSCWPLTHHVVTGADAVSAEIRPFWPTARSWHSRVSR